MKIHEEVHDVQQTSTNINKHYFMECTGMQEPRSWLVLKSSTDEGSHAVYQRSFFKVWELAKGDRRPFWRHSKKNEQEKHRTARSCCCVSFLHQLRQRLLAWWWWLHVCPLWDERWTELRHKFLFVGFKCTKNYQALDLSSFTDVPPC